jgi:uncharacterized alpha-E superfamily protein
MPADRQEAPMLLSRVAESAYWAGRYLERAEDIARLARVHTELYLDLPKAAGLGWFPLLAVTGSAADYRTHHREATEEEVIGFLATDPDNPGSIVASLARARANMRVARSVFPGETWHAVNDFHRWAVDASDEAVGRRTRVRWMEAVVHRCQLLAGQMEGVMSHDQAYAFLEVGRFLERTDMTSRVLDVQAEVLLGVGDIVGPYTDLTWMSVLRSLNAHHTYRRSRGGAVSGAEALGFLLKDGQCPRSVEHCLIALARSLLELPRCQEAMAVCAELQTRLEAEDVTELAAAGLHDWVEHLQAGIGDLHDMLAATYFSTGADELVRIA